MLTAGSRIWSRQVEWEVELEGAGLVMGAHLKSITLAGLALLFALCITLIVALHAVTPTKAVIGCASHLWSMDELRWRWRWRWRSQRRRSWR